MVTSRIGRKVERIGRRLQDWGVEPPPTYWLVERMTPGGGWETISKHDDGPPEQKSPDSVRPPARVRCTRRVGGRIDEGGVEWTAEHPDAGQRYDRLRLRSTIEERARQLVTVDDRATIALELLELYPDPELSADVLEELLALVETIEDAVDEAAADQEDRDVEDRLVDEMLEGNISADDAEQVAEAVGAVRGSSLRRFLDAQAGGEEI